MFAGSQNTFGRTMQFLQQSFQSTKLTCHFLAYTATHHSFQSKFLKMTWEAVHDLTLKTHSSFRLPPFTVPAWQCFSQLRLSKCPIHVLSYLCTSPPCNFPRFTFAGTCTFPIIFSS